MACRRSWNRKGGIRSFGDHASSGLDDRSRSLPGLLLRPGGRRADQSALLLRVLFAISRPRVAAPMFEL
jgi:hypothetical protein